jgi:hypothetical protein
MQHSGKTQIVDVKRLAGNFLAAFFAGDGFADEGHGFLNLIRQHGHIADDQAVTLHVSDTLRKPRGRTDELGGPNPTSWRIALSGQAAQLSSHPTGASEDSDREIPFPHDRGEEDWAD